MFAGAAQLELDGMEGLYLVTVEVVPAQGSAADEEHGGAYINVYTTDATESEALRTARREIAEAGWKIKSIRNSAWVTRADYSDPEIETRGLEYFDQALIDGVVVVIHAFPIGLDNDDVLH